MKTLHLIRHAKSSWDFPDLSDHQRPLNPRGIHSCEIMGLKLVEADCSFDHVFCSSARRAQDTITGIYQSLPVSAPEWQTDEMLYTFSSYELIHWCRNAESSINNLTLVGHNPAITDLVNELSDSDLLNVPTCAYVRLECDIRNWSELKSGCAHLGCFIKPKMFMK
ncbi:histidine phosphatase family protein [Sansalvadorimonas sp. 2012CJ34-2]|uniref:Histidine phosphatase family protein n=1 Tax=Parendozoicomonas callyspongiae TaxID=2942213 RepID=A0ABT0PG09_9GAMM|nr:histidine phosphatase family protein [Sansalvadorimonas sp. 2012CJ34-2]MCL6270299.1 histidine phosphatase family protein [Sansalvadorimonas sp. 2012CJ34-2]